MRWWITWEFWKGFMSSFLEGWTREVTYDDPFQKSMSEDGAPSGLLSLGLGRENTIGWSSHMPCHHPWLPLHCKPATHQVLQALISPSQGSLRCSPTFPSCHCLRFGPLSSLAWLSPAASSMAFFPLATPTHIFTMDLSRITFLIHWIIRPTLFMMSSNSSAGL